MLPLNGCRAAGSRPPAITQIDGLGPGELDVGARGVEVGVVGNHVPGLHSSANRIRSAARPWWVGMTCRKPKMSCTAASKRYEARLPAYDSSPRMMAAHWSRAHGCGAAVGQQVDQHVLGGQQKQVEPGAAQLSLRSSRVVIRIGSTPLIRNGSMMVRMG